MPIPTVALLLYPNFNPFQFSVPYMVFSTEIDEKPLFKVKIVAENPMFARSYPATIMTDGDLSLLAQADFVVIPGWDNVAHPLLMRSYKRYNKRQNVVRRLSDCVMVPIHWLMQDC